MPSRAAENLSYRYRVLLIKTVAQGDLRACLSHIGLEDVAQATGMGCSYFSLSQST